MTGFPLLELNKFGPGIVQTPILGPTTILSKAIKLNLRLVIGYLDLTGLGPPLFLVVRNQLFRARATRRPKISQPAGFRVNPGPGNQKERFRGPQQRRAQRWFPFKGTKVLRDLPLGLWHKSFGAPKGTLGLAFGALRLGLWRLGLAWRFAALGALGAFGPFSRFEGLLGALGAFGGFGAFGPWALRPLGLWGPLGPFGLGPAGTPGPLGTLRLSEPLASLWGTAALAPSRAPDPREPREPGIPGPRKPEHRRPGTRGARGTRGSGRTPRTRRHRRTRKHRATRESRETRITQGLRDRRVRRIGARNSPTESQRLRTDFQTACTSETPFDPQTTCASQRRSTADALEKTRPPATFLPATGSAPRRREAARLATDTA